MSFADYCSIAGLPIGLLGLGYAVWQQHRADSETAKRRILASEAHRFLVGLKPSVQNISGVTQAIDDQLERLKSSL